jgi:hypothetical protein
VSYETLLAEYSCREGAIELLRQYRPYLELIPSMRRPEQSLITIPLPLVRIRQPAALETRKTVQLACDLALLMCDPEWKIKLGSEILVFIHRPGEDFSDLLRRWRETQMYLDKDYEWLMPPQEQHMFSEGADTIHPLFVVFEKTAPRIKKGLKGACLPMVIQNDAPILNDESLELST